MKIEGKMKKFWCYKLFSLYITNFIFFKHEGVFIIYLIFIIKKLQFPKAHFFIIK